MEEAGAEYRTAMQCVGSVLPSCKEGSEYVSRRVRNVCGRFSITKRVKRWQAISMSRVFIIL